MDPSSSRDTRVARLSAVLLVIGLLAVIASSFAMGLGHLNAPDRPLLQGVRAYGLFGGIGLLVVSVLLHLVTRNRSR
jgi:hypothetical protein